MSDTILELQQISRHFGALQAVDNVSLSVRRGSMTGLIGPNGAGKSTLFNLLTGTLQATSGSIYFNGDEITRTPPQRLFAAGLARTFQIPRPFRKMSVLENLMLGPLSQIGEQVSGPVFRAAAVRRQEDNIRQKAMEVLRFVTLDHLADHAAGLISGGQMKLLELARVLMADPTLILLDEPAAGVNPSLTQILVERIEALNKQGTTFLVIEHDMDFVMRHCDPIVAMAQGAVVFEGTSDEALSNPLLLDAYLGEVAGA